MSSKKGIYIIVSVVSIFILLGFSVVFIAVYAFPFDPQKNSSIISQNSSSFFEIELNSSGEFNSETSSTFEPNEVTSGYDGKIIKAFLSPYISNTSYRNIYLNNKTATDINLASIYDLPLETKIKKCTEPEVLILHTHATEGYLPQEKEYYSQEDIEQTHDEERSVLKIGEIICQELKEYGINAIHDKTLHDDPSYTNSYNRSAETTLKYLENYPSIKVVIDIHRDSISSNGGLIRGISEQKGKDAAQIMFVAGSETGNVEGFPNWEQNLGLVLRLQEISETLYPGFARSIYFTSKKYNQHLSIGSLLIEVGSSVNTIEEAEYSAKLLGRILGVGLNLLAEE